MIVLLYFVGAINILFSCCKEERGKLFACSYNYIALHSVSYTYIYVFSHGPNLEFPYFLAEILVLSVIIFVCTYNYVLYPKL